MNETETKDDFTFERSVKEVLADHMAKSQQEDGGSFTIVQAMGGLENAKMDIVTGDVFAIQELEQTMALFEEGEVEETAQAMSKTACSPFHEDLRGVITEHEGHVSVDSMLGVFALCQMDIGFSVFGKAFEMDRIAHHMEQKPQIIVPEKPPIVT